MLRYLVMQLQLQLQLQCISRHETPVMPTSFRSQWSQPARSRIVE